MITYKKYLIPFLLFTALSACSSDNTTCRVVGVSDGDTVTCLAKGNTQLKVRLAEIDAPEKRQAFGQKAKKALSDMVFQRNVRLDVTGTDRYKRTIAIIYHDGKNINLEMVKKGMAWAYVQYSKDPIYLAEQEKARAKRIGLWADSNPMSPHEWRKQEKAKNK